MWIRTLGCWIPRCRRTDACNTSGPKRHLVVDMRGLMLAVVTHLAGVKDQEGALFVLKALDRMRLRFLRCVRRSLVDLIS